MLGPVDPDWAGRVLADLVELYRTGLAEPLPFAPRTSAEYALVRSRDRSLALYETKISAVWDQERDPVWERFLGPGAGLRVLMEQPSRSLGGARDAGRADPVRHPGSTGLLPVAPRGGADVTAPSAFDVGGELPRRTTVLEASAGTGKTYTIAALVARYLAEGHAELGELMIVTFGRMATDELRVRVRERLVSLEHALTGALEGRQAPAEADPVNKLLATGEVTELVLRRDRIRRALSDFDAATIATTHEFCQRMLDGLGVLGNREPDAVFSEWLGDLTVRGDPGRLSAALRRRRGRAVLLRGRVPAGQHGRGLSARPAGALPAAFGPGRGPSPRSRRGSARSTSPKRSGPRCSGASSGPGCSATTTC